MEDDSATDVVLRTMEALETVEDVPPLMAHLVGTIYELAMRLDVQPRTIADNAFTCVSSNEKWETQTLPLLREQLGRH